MRELVVVITAFLAAALSASLVLYLAVVPRGSYAQVNPLLMLLSFGYCLIPASAFIVVFLVLRSVHALRWWSAAIGGVVVGVLLWTAFPGVDVWPVLQLWVIVSTVTGFVFWAVWRAGMRHSVLGAEAPPSSDVPSA